MKINHPKISRGWKFTFGKHRGETLQRVATEDLEYVNWCIDNIEWFRKSLLDLRKSDKWIGKLIWCIKTERVNLREREQAWAWGLIRFPHFGDKTVKILYDGRDDEEQDEDELTGGDFGMPEGQMVCDD